MFRRMTSRRLAANTPVIACGYMNRARAEPSASVAKAHSLAGVGMSEPNGLWVLGLVVFRCASATSKMCPQPPSLRRDVQDGHDDHDVDQGVLDERDQRRRAQPGEVGIGGQDDERDQQRQVPDEAVGGGAADAEDGQHGLDADQLKRDVRHGGQDPGPGDREREPARAVPAADEVSRGDVAVHPGDRP